MMDRLKKVIALLVVVLQFFVWTYSFAEESIAGIDLQALSTDELLHLRVIVEEELNTRISEGNGSIYPGTYVVGKDIRNGIYLFTGTKTDLHDKAQVAWYDSNDTFIDTEYLGEGEVLNLPLEDGMVLKVIYNPCLIQEAPIMPFVPN